MIQNITSNPITCLEHPKPNTAGNKDDLPFILQMRHLQQLLGFSRSKIYALSAEPGFPAIQIGRRRIVYRDEFFAWLDTQRRS